MSGADLFAREYVPEEYEGGPVSVQVVGQRLEEEKASGMDHSLALWKLTIFARFWHCAKL